MKFPGHTKQNACALQPRQICPYRKTHPSLASNSEIESEYGQLKEMVPTLSKQPYTTKKQVVAEATCYIDELHTELVSKLQTKGDPDDFHVMLNAVNQMVLSLMSNNLTVNPQTNKKSSSQRNYKKCRKQSKEHKKNDQTEK